MVAEAQYPFICGCSHDHGGSTHTSGSTTPRKKNSMTGEDRQAFYRILVGIYKSQKKNQENRGTVDEQELYERQKSKEDIRYQSDLNDLIWLVRRKYVKET